MRRRMGRFLEADDGGLYTCDLLLGPVGEEEGRVAGCADAAQEDVGILRAAVQELPSVELGQIKAPLGPIGNDGFFPPGEGFLDSVDDGLIHFIAAGPDGRADGDKAVRRIRTEVVAHGAQNVSGDTGGRTPPTGMTGASHAAYGIEE